MTIAPSHVRSALQSVLVIPITTITWEHTNQRKSQRHCSSVNSVIMKPLTNRTLKAHTEKKDGNESNSMSCPDCGKSFPQQHHLTRNVQIDRKGNEKNMAVSSGCFFIFSLSYLFLFLHRWCPRACRKGDIEHWFRNVWEKGKRESCQPIPLQQVLWNIWKQLELEQAHEKKACKE